ncbi:Protein kinase superfamily protein [Klebsormidium nitens]|uniref:Protein kinase superfamily protein n=1 Tax=Klebsormidium nitens TaxID=105231 RepID=A0A1Y1I6N2_KLENI|nr:Protein kinase superfamily protein [Klebsormidium nitens]|eukprot:GAQ84386.1 Protein kinase superfamily protein [Klebsormidium nitens]
MSKAVLVLSRGSGDTRPTASSLEVRGGSSGRRAGAGSDGNMGDGRQEQGAHEGAQREGRSLQPSTSLDTPSERSAAERHSLERMLKQEGAGRLHALPDSQGGNMAGMASSAASHTLLQKERWPWAEAASGSPVSVEAPIGGAPAGRGGDGPAAKSQQELTSGGMEGLTGMPAAERLLNSISLSELYLGDRFASGTYGRLYTGVFRGQTVAIKIVRSPESEQAAFQMADMFSREFMGACQKPPLHCLVTELLPGGTLRKYLSGPTAPPPFAVALRMALDVARGMDYLHSKNIIHRDLKADNLVLSRSHVVKLTDFGSARVESEEGAQMTAETGTFKFMAPEVIRRRGYSRKVDVYSFGILLWELFTAEVAFAGMSGVQAAFAVVNKVSARLGLLGGRRGLAAGTPHLSHRKRCHH